MNRIVLIGSKEFAQQIRMTVARCGEYKVVGYLDDNEIAGTIIEGLPVMGKLSDADVLYKKGLFDSLFVAAGYLNFTFREKAYSLWKGKIPYANIIDKDAVLAPSVIIGEGVYIGPDSIIDEGTVIGNNVFIHGKTQLGHDNRVGSHTYFSGRIDTAGFCEIGERNFIGIRVLFADHVSTCDDVWIGLGCIVAKSISSPGKYMTNAAKLYKIE